MTLTGSLWATNCGTGSTRQVNFWHRTPVLGSLQYFRYRV
jgi:hypothetical protein